MVHSKVIVCLILATQLLFYCEGSQYGRQNTDQPSRRHRSSAQVNENDNERDLQIRLSSATNLESLILETINVFGTGICSSPFALSVMQGTWRNITPDEGERKDNLKLRKTCSGVLEPSDILPPPEPKVLHSRQRGLADAPAPQEEQTFSLLKPQESFTRGRAMPTTRKSEPATTAEILQRANEILKDRSADCKPRPVPVEIAKVPNITWLPSCAMVERCGGCCKHDSLQCVPTNTSFITKKVIAMNNKGVHLNVKDVMIEKHNKCKCECKIKASNCTSQQIYDKNNCKCVCKSSGPKGLPRSCKKPLHWDEHSCKCRCPHHTIVDCSTGSYFSSEQCRCVTADDILTEQQNKRA